MNTQNEKAYKRSCLFLLLMVFVVLPVSLILLVLLLWWGRESSGNRRLAARKASIAKQGLPIDDDSMDRFFKERTDATHTAAWQGILATMSGDDFKDSLNGVAILSVTVEEPIVPDVEWKEEAASVAFLEKWKALHSEVVQLSIDAKPVRFPTVFNSFNTLFPEVQELRQVARLLELQGRVGLRARNSAIVRENVDALLGLSQVPTGCSSLISQLVAFAMDGIGINLLKDAIEYDVLNEADLQSLLPKVLKSVNVNEWKTTIASERGLALPIFSNPKKASSAGLPAIPGRSRDTLLYLDLTEGVMNVPTENLVEFKAQLQKMEAKVQEIAQANLLSKFDSIMTLQTLPAVGACGEAFIRRALLHRIATLAIGLRIYEDRNATLPDSLEALSGISMDIKPLAPSDSISFGYRKEGSNAKLWGGSHKDTLSIAPEPHESKSEGEENLAKSNRELWLWELRAEKK